MYFTGAAIVEISQTLIAPLSSPESRISPSSRKARTEPLALRGIWNISAPVAAFHNRTVLSGPVVAIHWPLELTFTSEITLFCNMRSRSVPVFISQTLILRSSDTVTNQELSGLKATSWTESSLATGMTTSPVSVRTTMAVLSCPPVAMNLLFGLNDIASTSPLCLGRDMLLPSFRFQTVTTPVLEPVAIHTPSGLKAETLSLPVVCRSEIFLL